MNTNQANVISVKSIMNKISLGVELSPGGVYDASTTNLGLTVLRYTNIPTTPIAPNSNFQFTAPGLSIPGQTAPMDLVATRYAINSFYGNNYANNTFSIVGFQVISKTNNQIIPVTSQNPPIDIIISGTGPSSYCSYFNTITNAWQTDGVGSIDTNNRLHCNSTHLTEFSGFSSGSSSSPTTPASNNLYYLLLLLLIFPICLIFAVIIGFIGFTIFKIFQGRGKINLKLGLKGEPKTGAVPTEGQHDMIDLGI